ncbi:hypothetical protein AAE478_006711 [Parahypoxylon ruwenzoriense]
MAFITKQVVLNPAVRRWLDAEGGDIDRAFGKASDTPMPLVLLAKTARRSRTEIPEAFEEILIPAASARAKLKAFPYNQDIKACSERLNVTVLISVSELMGSLLPERKPI